MAPLRYADGRLECLLVGDTVAKVVLQKVSNFLRAAGAVFV
jgi:hypothetical protein